MNKISELMNKHEISELMNKYIELENGLECFLLELELLELEIDKSINNMITKMKTKLEEAAEKNERQI